MLKLHVFADESYGGTHEGILTLAGFLAPRESWNRFSAEWSGVLAAFGVRVFHATDCETGYGEFKGWPKERREQLQQALTSVLANPAFGPLLGYAVSLNRRDYEAIRPRMRKSMHLPTGQGISGPVDDPYFLLFQWLVHSVLTEEYVAELPSQEQVNFTFDQHDFSARANLVHRAMRAHRKEYGFRVGPCAFADKVGLTPLQAADFLAYESFRAACASRDTGQSERWQYTAIKHQVRSASFYDEEHLAETATSHEAKVARLVAGGVTLPERKTRPPKAPHSLSKSQRVRKLIVSRWRKLVRFFRDRRPRA